MCSGLLTAWRSQPPRQGPDPSTQPAARPPVACHPLTLALSDAELEARCHAHMYRPSFTYNSWWMPLVAAGVAIIGCTSALRHASSGIHTSCHTILLMHGMLGLTGVLLSSAPLPDAMRRRWRAPAVAVMRVAPYAVLITCTARRRMLMDMCSARALVRNLMLNTGAAGLAFYGTIHHLPFTWHLPLHTASWLLWAASGAPEAVHSICQHTCQLAVTTAIYRHAGAAFGVVNALLVGVPEPHAAAVDTRFAAAVVVQFVLLVVGCLLPLTVGYLRERRLRCSFLEGAGCHGVLSRLHRRAMLLAAPLACHAAWALAHPLAHHMERLHRAHFSANIAV